MTARPTPANKDLFARMNRHLVFVYGSLKKGFHNHSILRDCAANAMGPATTEERYLLLKGAAFPYLINPEYFTTLVDCAGILGKVAGELYYINDSGLAALDRLEGHPEFYRREKIKVTPHFYKKPWVEAWVYFLVNPSDRVGPIVWDQEATQPDARGVVSWELSDVFASAAAEDAAEE